jgi:hypothetical protein
VGIFIEHFASRQDFEEWLASAGERVKVRNVSMGTRRGAPPDASTTYTVTYEATVQVSRRVSSET